MSNEADNAKKAIKSTSGFVVSAKCDQSIVVMIERKVMHSLYKKFIKKSKRIMAHDAENECSEGDYVKIRESRPHSKKKTWELDSILEKASS